MPRREAILISDFQRSGWQGGEGVRLPDGAVLTPVAITDSGKAEPGDRAGLAAAVGVSEPAAHHGDDRRGQSHRRRRVERRDRARDRRPRDPVAARQRRGARLGVDDVRSGHGGRSQRARDRAARQRRARARQRVSTSSSRRKSRSTSSSASGRVGPQHEPVPDAGGRGQRGAAHRGQGRARPTRSRTRISPRRRSSSSTTRRLRRRPPSGCRPSCSAAAGCSWSPARSATWPSVADILPGVPGAAVDRSRGAAARLGALEYGHPLFEVFRGPRTGDFASARFYGYRSVTPAPGQHDAGAIRRRAAGAARAKGRDRPRADVDVDARHDVDRPRAQARVRALHPPRRSLPRRVSRAEALADGRRRCRPRTPGAGEGFRRVAGRADAVGQRISLDGDGPEVLELAEQGFYEFRAQGRDAEHAGRRGEQRRPRRIGPDAARSAGNCRGGARPRRRRRGRTAGPADRRRAGIGPARLVVSAVCRAAAARRRNYRGQPVDSVSWFQELNAYGDHRGAAVGKSFESGRGHPSDPAALALQADAPRRGRRARPRRRWRSCCRPGGSSRGGSAPAPSSPSGSWSPSRSPAHRLVPRAAAASGASPTSRSRSISKSTSRRCRQRSSARSKPAGWPTTDTRRIRRCWCAGSSQSAVAKCEAIDWGRNVERQPMRRYAATFAVIAVAAIALFTLGPRFLRHGLSALFVVSRSVEAAAPYRIDVTPGQRHRAARRRPDDHRDARRLRGRPGVADGAQGARRAVRAHAARAQREQQRGATSTKACCSISPDRSTTSSRRRA